LIGKRLLERGKKFAMDYRTHVAEKAASACLDVDLEVKIAFKVEKEDGNLVDSPILRQADFVKKFTRSAAPSFGSLKYAANGKPQLFNTRNNSADTMLYKRPPDSSETIAHIA
jgi:hypothetical protein